MKMKPSLTIQIVGWNSAHHLPAALAALKEIPLAECIIRYIDNNSHDDSVMIVRALLPQTDVIVLPENVGFAKAHNIGLAACTTPFVLTHDPDLVITWQGIKDLLGSFEDKDVAAVQGKLLRASSTDTATILDSAGIVQTMTLNGKERGAGEVDRGQYNAPAKLLAVTGACGLYRMSALQEISYSADEFFDNDFFAYKEDVDLGWRLNKAGYVCKYEPIVVGVHARTLGKGSRQNWGGSLFSFWQRLKSPRTRYSLRNYAWMIMKNTSGWQFFWHDAFIESRLFIFFCLSLLYPPLFSVWHEIWQGAPHMLKKRVTS